MIAPEPDSALLGHPIEQGVSTREISLLKGGPRPLLEAARASLPSAKAVSVTFPFVTTEAFFAMTFQLLLCLPCSIQFFFLFSLSLKP